jgi:UDPglucose 6-dehydrogenase
MPRHCPTTSRWNPQRSPTPPRKRRRRRSDRGALPLPLLPASDPSTSTPHQRSISIVGTGYVGLVTGLAFAELGHMITCVDVVPERVEWVSRGEAPFYDPGVAEALRRQVDSGLVDATTDTAEAIARTEATFLCVGTPSAQDGSYDLGQMATASRSVGEAIADLDRHHLVVTKSTLTPGASRGVVLPALEEGAGGKAPNAFSLANNPEFLREGSALRDALEPDRIVIGVMEGDNGAAELLVDLYRPLRRPILVTTLEGAELIKLASNSLLAIKVAFANEVANLAAEVGADGYEVLEGVGLDHRLGPHFLRAGAGFGGSCFPKDLRALVAFGESVGLPLLMPSAALDQNEVQPRRVIGLLQQGLGGDLVGKRVALLGLAFKPETDDVRETRALPILRDLMGAGASVVCHDPKAGDNFLALTKEVGMEGFSLAADVGTAISGADAVVIQTEWDEYKALEPSELVRRMAPSPVVVDARRALDPEAMVAAGVRYLGVGYPA